MRSVIHPSTINGAIAAPPSKSMSQRAYALALLHEGTTTITNAGNSNDENAALEIIKQLGATVMENVPGKIVVHSEGILPVTDTIDCRESGLAARLFIPISALAENAITVNGSGSLLHRPMEGIDTTMGQLGVSLSEFKGFLPLVLKGPLQCRDITIDAANGSQLLSGLLLAMSYRTTQPVTITVTNLKSKPYIDLTLEMLKAFGKPVKNISYTSFIIDPQHFSTIFAPIINVEGDWSGAANLLVAGAIAGDVTVNNLNVNSAQADRAILEILQTIGANVSIAGNSITVKSAPLRAFDFDATHCPDLFPILSILAACSRGDSSIQGIHRLFHKESNRAESIAEMLQNFDVPFSIEDDAICITGVKHLQGTIIDSYNDHRIAMAAAIGALRANGPVDILQSNSVNKSYPGFFNDLKALGGKVL